MTSTPQPPDPDSRVANLEQRIIDLEIKLSHTERLLDEVNDVVIEHATALEQTQTTLETMRRVVVEVREQMGEGGDVEGAMPENDPVPNSG